jgi:hypothetical protein
MRFSRGLMVSAAMLTALGAGGAHADEAEAWRLFVPDHAEPVVNVIDAMSGERLDTMSVKGTGDAAPDVERRDGLRGTGRGGRGLGDRQRHRVPRSRRPRRHRHRRCKAVGFRPRGEQAGAFRRASGPDRHVLRWRGFRTADDGEGRSGRQGGHDFRSRSARRITAWRCLTGLMRSSPFPTRKTHRSVRSALGSSAMTAYRSGRSTTARPAWLGGFRQSLRARLRHRHSGDQERQRRARDRTPRLFGHAAGGQFPRRFSAARDCNTSSAITARRRWC